MRSFWCWTLLPLGALAGCGQGGRATPVEAPPHVRDLTTPQTASPQVQVISSREVIRAEPARRSKPRVPRLARTEPVASPASTPASVLPVVAPARLAPAPLATPVAWKGGAATLEAGQTVTIVPASSGPSPAPDADSSPMSERRGGGVRIGGGGCHPRGGRGGTSVFRLSR
ncbi:MAG: hypothetical protein ACJ8DC_00190 [Gemmatimonadales bacterium]